MNILVPVKRVIDANVRVRVRADGSAVDLDNVKMAMNPFCEIAVEEALRLKEAGHAEAVVLATVGGEKCQDTLRAGLAMGADRAVHITTDQSPEPLGVAKLLAKLVERDDYGLVILGKQAIDDDNNQTGQMLAALLGWPLGAYISKVLPDGDGYKLTREIDGGLEQLQMTGKCVLTADLRLNEPRYASLPNIMKAKQKPLDTLTAEELGVALENRLEILGVSEPPSRAAGVRVSGAAELVAKLKDEAKVI